MNPTLKERIVNFFSLTEKNEEKPSENLNSSIPKKLFIENSETIAIERTAELLGCDNEYLVSITEVKVQSTADTYAEVLNNYGKAEKGSLGAIATKQRHKDILIREIKSCTSLEELGDPESNKYLDPPKIIYYPDSQQVKAAYNEKWDELALNSYQTANTLEEYRVVHAKSRPNSAPYIMSSVKINDFYIIDINKMNNLADINNCLNEIEEINNMHNKNYICMDKAYKVARNKRDNLLLSDLTVKVSKTTNLIDLEKIIADTRGGPVFGVAITGLTDKESKLFYQAKSEAKTAKNFMDLYPHCKFKEENRTILKDCLSVAKSLHYIGQVWNKAKESEFLDIQKDAEDKWCKTFLGMMENSKTPDSFLTFIAYANTGDFRYVFELVNTACNKYTEELKTIINTFSFNETYSIFVEVNSEHHNLLLLELLFERIFITTKTSIEAIAIYKLFYKGEFNKCYSPSRDEIVIIDKANLLEKIDSICIAEINNVQNTELDVIKLKQIFSLDKIASENDRDGIKSIDLAAIKLYEIFREQSRPI